MSKPIWTQFGCNQKNGPTEGHKTHRGILVDDNWLKIDDIYHLSVSMWHINWSGLIWLGKKIFGWPLLHSALSECIFVRAVGSNISDAHQCFWEKKYGNGLIS